MYIHWQRTFLHPQLLAFDAPSREECTARRPISNTPKAALTLLNDPTFVEAARVLAENVVRHGGGSVEERLRWAFRQVLARAPTGEEASLLGDVLNRHKQHFADSPQAVKEVMQVGQHPAPDSLPLSEVAAWTSVARVLLNLGETTMRE